MALIEIFLLAMMLQLCETARNCRCLILIQLKLDIEETTHVSPQTELELFIIVHFCPLMVIEQNYINI